MALRDIFKRNTELSDTPVKKASSDMTSEVGVAGEVLFTGYENEEQRADKVSITDYRKMIDKDGTAQALYNILTFPILATSYEIRADKDDTNEEQALFVRKNLLEPAHKGGMETPFDLFLLQMMRSFLDGFQLFEKVYMVKDGKYVLRKLANRDSVGIWLKRDEFGGFGGANQRVLYENKYKWIEMDAYKLFLFTYGKEHSYLYGRSAFTAAYTHYDKKRRLEYLDSISIQNDAIKAKLLKRTEQGTLGKDGKAARNKALAALAKLGETKPVASIPYGYEVDTLDANGRDAGPSIERQNAEMARSLLAQFILLGTQGSTSVGSFALSENSSDIFKIALKGTMQNIENHINNYLIADLIDINFPTQYYPEFHFNDLTSEALNAISEAFLQLVKNKQLSTEMIKGIEDATASRLEIDTEQIRKELDKQAAAAAKDASKNNDTQNPGDAGNDGGAANPGGRFPDKQLSDSSMLDELGIDKSDLGCIMLKTQPLDVLKYVKDGSADLAPTDNDRSNVTGENASHVTLLFGLMENGNKLKPQVDKLLTGIDIPDVKISGVEAFGSQDADTVPIVATVELTPELQKAHKELTRLPHANTYPDYKPHITLAYVKNDEATIKKWVDALKAVYVGKSIKTDGIDYGDLPSDSKALSDDQPQWHRELTAAEQGVKLSELNTKMDTLESQLVESMQPTVDGVIKQLASQAANARAATDITVTLPADYGKSLVASIKAAYNYGKTAAADEHKVAAPATSKDAVDGINQLAQFVVDKQQDDLKNLLRAEWIKAKRTAQLADTSGDNSDLEQQDTIPQTPEKKAAQTAAFEASLASMLATWFTTKLKATASSVVPQGVNNGRNDVFIAIVEDGDLFQYSAILDGKCTSGICPPLDGKVVDKNGFILTPWQPPLHFNCRCIWVMIRKIAQGRIDTAIPAVTGLPDKSNGFSGPQI